MAKGDTRAVVGASGKPLEGMKLESGTKTIAKVLGCYDAPSGPKKGQRELRGVRFDFEPGKK